MTSELKSDLSSFGYADGGYMSKCSHCKETFLGAKRSWSCEPCAIKKSLEPKIEQPKPDVPELVRYNVDVEKNIDGYWEGILYISHNGKYVRHDQATEQLLISKNLSALQSETIVLLEKDVSDLRQRAEAAETKLAEWEKSDRLVAKALWEDRVKELEAKLAQIEKQEVVDDEPVYYALTDSDWSFDDQDEGRATIVLANSPEEAVRKATDIEIAEQGEGVGIHWKVAKLTLVGFQGAEWDNSKPSFDQFQPFTAPITSDADLRAERDRYRLALEFYADTSKYPAPLTGGMGDLWSDCGQIARAALNVEVSNDKK